MVYPNCAYSMKKKVINQSKTHLSNYHRQYCWFLGHHHTKKAKVLLHFPNRSGLDSISVLDVVVNVAMNTAHCSREHWQMRQGQHHLMAWPTNTDFLCICTTLVHLYQSEMNSKKLSMLIQYVGQEGSLFDQHRDYK